jgi:hypothetical protein
MTLIATQTLGTAATTIQFTSIPSSYTDLLFVASTRSSTAGTSVEICSITFNSNATGYTVRAFSGTGTSTNTSLSTGLVFYAPRAGTTANTFGNAAVYIPNYTSAINKNYWSESATEHNGTEGYNTLTSGLWSNTAAITSASFAPNANNFEANSTISLYGITKGTDGIVTTSP